MEGREPGSSQSPGASRHSAPPHGGHRARQKEGFGNPSRKQASPHHAGAITGQEPAEIPAKGWESSEASDPAGRCLGSTWWLLRVLTEATLRTTKAFVTGSPEKTQKRFLCGPHAVRSCSKAGLWTAVLWDLKFLAVPEPRAGPPVAKEWLLQGLASAGCAPMAPAAAGCVTSERAGKTNSGARCSWWQPLRGAQYPQ